MKDPTRFPLSLKCCACAVWVLLCASVAIGQDHSAPAVEKLPEGVMRVGPVELKIDREAITPLWIPRPLPQGTIDVNPPWLHVAVPILDGNESTNPERRSKREAQKWNRRFYFKLSQDSSFQSGVMESGPKRWSFYNPYRRLEPGTWYWTYGLARAETPDKPVWNKEIYSFRISGREYTYEIPPTPEAFLAAVKKRNAGPIVTCFPEEVGHLLPTETAPSLAEQIRKDCERAFETMNAKGSEVAKVSDKQPPGGAKEKPSLLERKQASARALVESRRINSLLRGYLLTGEEKYKNLAIHLLTGGAKLEKPVPGELVLHRPGGGKTLVNETDIILLDTLYNELSKADRIKHFQAIYNAICDDGSDSPDTHENIEHMLYDNHAWQGHLPGLFRSAILLCRYKPELDDWVKYAYEVYLYRAPAFSRTDGGSSEGNGYLGVHDEPLTDIPWLIYKLTGYNVLNNKRWFQNFGNYMTFSNPSGNPGISFEDSGVDGGSDMQYFSEFLARACPANLSNLWQCKSVGRREEKYFSADLNKGAKAWDMLSIWKRLPMPDLGKAVPPSEKAAQFGDIGLVCMHTDLAKAGDNLMLNFRAGPYGSEGHTHPAQNAFTVAYGGQELFWRTGYYNGGGLHNIYSYKSSRSHNTIMADGLVQGFDQGAYAWIARFATGNRISYALGDASHAYNGKHHNFDIPYQPDLKGNKVEERRNWEEATAANGFGNPGVTRFRRHMVMLRPSHVLIYDELEAAKPVTWTFQLHSRMEMKQLGDSWFKTANDHALGSAQLFCASPMKGELTDKFRADAVDEENKRNGQNPPNWHATMTTRDRLPATRFLTVIDVIPGKDLAASPARLVPEGAGRTRWQIGEYSVTAELDPSKPSYLEVHDSTATCALVTGQATRGIELGGQQRNAKLPGSTLLWEKSETGGEVFQEKVDELPDCLKFGNPF
ncbi:DUF4962 domain-containing protein [Luteolibacter ambystomatis]|uniref:DUF4962 domain-containing protein n=1 Tax=Luteolibacter ambystomatis TaxID=2824561 RepID=A0A975J0T2_9BACT|nr:DUF4962 domain-containing protein [Luteolibacter ambystomatis]QUE51930.1 DUF4962 domain-containing protein [Luteolibacter ambystomatis]